MHTKVTLKQFVLRMIVVALTATVSLGTTKMPETKKANNEILRRSIEGGSSKQIINKAAKIDDEEIDFKKLNTPLSEAILAIRALLAQCDLLAQHNKLYIYLSSEGFPINTKPLLKLHKEMEWSLDDFEAQYQKNVASIWNAERQVGITVGKVRSLLQPYKSNEKHLFLETIYDADILNLEKVATNEKDPNRKKRFESILNNIYVLRDFYSESHGMHGKVIKLRKFSQSVHTKLVESFMDLEMALAKTYFLGEQLRPILLDDLPKSSTNSEILSRINRTTRLIDRLSDTNSGLERHCKKVVKLINKYGDKIEDKIMILANKS